MHLATLVAVNACALNSNLVNGACRRANPHFAGLGSGYKVLPGRTWSKEHSLLLHAASGEKPLSLRTSGTRRTCILSFLNYFVGVSRPRDRSQSLGLDLELILPGRVQFFDAYLPSYVTFRRF